MPKVKFVIFDDFHPDPDSVREMALGLEYPATGRYPGRNSQNVEPEEWLAVVSELLNMAIRPKAGHNDIALFRRSEPQEWSGSDIHFDRTDWAGVCYLTPQDSLRGGTVFFRHIESGLDHWPDLDERAAMVDRGLIECSDLSDERAFQLYFAKDCWDRSKWQQVFAIPYRYNRAAFYDASQFHTIDGLDTFGTERHARLTQIFFFDVNREIQ